MSGGIHCPKCGHGVTHVKDSRRVDRSNSVRRRKYCEACSFTFSTNEWVEGADEPSNKVGRPGKPVPITKMFYEIDQAVRRYKQQVESSDD